MIDSKFRNPYQKWVIGPFLRLDPISRWNPKALTMLGLFFGLLIPVFLFERHSLLALIALALSGFFDTLDGSLARLQKTSSPQGAALDIIVDRIVEFSLVIGLFFYDPITRALSCILMLGSILFCVTTFLVVGIFSQNESEKSFYYSPGLIERTEAFLFFGLMILFPKGFFILSFSFSLLVTLTGFIRIFQYLSLSKEELDIE